MPPEVDITETTVQTLARIAEGGQAWPQVAEKYGVTNPVPPWKSSLEGMCEALDRAGTALLPLTRRQDEDRLAEGVYANLPYPETQLIALAHSLIARDVIDETALAERMAAVRARLEAG
ncbi:thiocyanate hydrolase [Mycobacterium angelicum]|uniref:Thiocyanate hydrolase n=1 Tax=Mycobacterium angelicum TaxID=470074 RepID=A0A1X0A130_MYCAN|nr:thiocyanate hydrolase [Mycobacterium angelicum]MCV7195476.1 thiocyanate hydrolase [Mycobacterium angelicum]ORA23771.1 thiocyanate hydrolase [Mycobacterium angelicum]